MAQKSDFVVLKNQTVRLIALLMPMVFFLNCDVYDTSTVIYEGGFEKLAGQVRNITGQPSKYDAGINNLRVGMRTKVRKEFVPNGWKLVLSKQGDLNGDGIDDYVMLIESKERGKYRMRGSTQLNFNPRIMLVLLTDFSVNYTLVAKSDKSFIPAKNSKDTLCRADPLKNGEIGINNGKLAVAFNYEYDKSIVDCGAFNYNGNNFDRFVFKYQNNKIELVELERKRFISGEQLDVNVDFSNESVKVEVASNGNKKFVRRDIHIEEFYNLGNCHYAHKTAEEFATEGYESLKAFAGR